MSSLLARVAFEQTEAVSAQEIDQYLEALEEPKRGTLALLRQRILDVLPDAEQGISYGVPAFRVRGKTIAGFAARSAGREAGGGSAQAGVPGVRAPVTRSARRSPAGH
jgi:hypothetical protein